MCNFVLSLVTFASHFGELFVLVGYSLEARFNERLWVERVSSAGYFVI